MSEWYLLREGSKQGPLSTDDIRRMAREGSLQPSDILRREDLQKNIKAGQIKGLFPLQDAVPSTTQANPNQPLSGNVPSASFEEGTEAAADALSALQAAAQKTAGPGVGEARKSVRAGTEYAKAAVLSGSKKLKASFATSVKETLASGKHAAEHLRKHPFRLTIASIVLMVGCGFSATGFITLILLPMFVMGYIVYMESLILGQQPSFAMFIGFMRHGWNSVWHLFMMLASFFVTTALVLCPGIILALVLWFGIGTIGAGIGQISQGLSSDKYVPSHYDEYTPYRSRGHYEAPEPPGAVGRFFGRMGEEASMYLDAAVTIVIVVVVLTPLEALMILLFFFARDVASAGHDGGGSFNLVYDSFGRMLQMGRTRWKRLLCSGLFLSASVVLLTAACLLLGRLLGYVNLDVLSAWAVGILLPIAWFVLMIYSNVFLITTCLNLSSEVPLAIEP